MPFSGGSKGGILFGKRIPPLVPRRARRSPSRASAGKRMQRCRAAIESPAPYGRKKGAALSGCINSPPPFPAGETGCAAAIDLLEQPALLEAAKAEFRQRTVGGYTCPIPPDAVPAPLEL